MQTTEKIWHNGKIVAWSEAKIHVLSHTLHYGSGALEGIRFYDTAHGPAIFRLHEHIDRLLYSANVLQMPLPYSKEELSHAIIQIVIENKLIAGYIRPILFYGQGDLTINPAGHPVECAIACWPWESYFANKHIDVKIGSYVRLHPQSTIIDAKLSAHYLNGILSMLELQGTHYHDVLYLDYQGNIAEGVAANFFIVKSGVIYTPNIGSILIGITRETIIALANTLGYEVIETDITLTDVYAADEAFFTGTAAEVTAIRSINDKIIGHGTIGDVTQSLQSAYLAIVQGQNSAYFNYLTFIPSREHKRICA